MTDTLIRIARVIIISGFLFGLSTIAVGVAILNVYVICIGAPIVIVLGLVILLFFIDDFDDDTKKASDLKTQRFYEEDDWDT